MTPNDTTTTTQRGITRYPSDPVDNPDPTTEKGGSRPLEKGGSPDHPHPEQTFTRTDMASKNSSTCGTSERASSSTRSDNR